MAMGDSLNPTGILEGTPHPEHYEESEEAKETVAQVEELYRQSKDSKGVYENDWERFRLYLKGDQLLYTDRDTGQIINLADISNKRLYSVNNQLAVAHRALVGKLTRGLPSFTVTPGTGETDEVYGAKVAENFLRYWRKKEDFESQFVECMDNLAWCGNGIHELCWDPSAGRRLVWCEQCGFTHEDIEAEGQPCPVCQEQAQQVEQQQQQLVQAAQMGAMPADIVYQQGEQLEEQKPGPSTLELISEGDILLKTLDPRAVFIEPGKTRPEDLRYAIIRESLPVSEVAAMYPHMAPFLGPEKNRDTYVTAAMPQGIGYPSWGASQLSDTLDLYRYFEVPSELYPQGRVIVFANNILLEEKISPYWELGRLPLYFQFWDKRPGEFWAESPMHNAWSRQKEVNEVDTQIRENTELHSRTKVLVGIGNQISSDEFKAVTDQVIKFNPVGGKPEYMIPPSMPPDVYNRKDSLIMDIQTFYSLTEQELGRSANDPNGRAMAILEAESDQQLGPIQIRNRKEIAALHRGVLQLAQKFYSPERKFLVAGEEQMGVFSFQDMNLNPGWDVELEQDDGMSQNQALRRQDVVDLANLGIYNDPGTGAPDPRKIAKAARIKVPGLADDPQISESAAAYAICKQIEDGNFDIQPEAEDDPEIFQKVFLAWLRKEGRKPNVDPLVRDAIRARYMYYSKWAMMQAMGMGGGPQMPMGPDPGMGGGMGGPGMGGPDQTAPGGSANNPGNIASDAMAMVGQADQAAESAARTGPQHEG